MQLSWSPPNLPLPKGGVKEQIPHQQEVGNAPKLVIHKTQTPLTDWETTNMISSCQKQQPGDRIELPGLCEKRAFSFSCSWFMSSESYEEHRLTWLVLVLTLVINNSFYEAPALSHLSLQQGWLLRDSSRNCTEQWEGKGVWGSCKNLTSNSSYQSSTAQVCARVIGERWSHFQSVEWDHPPSHHIYGPQEQNHIKHRVSGYLIPLKMQAVHSSVPNKRKGVKSLATGFDSTRSQDEAISCVVLDHW